MPITLSGPSSYALAAADFNEDNRPDLVVFNELSGQVLLNEGRGGFAKGSEISFDHAYAVVTGDVNRDGHQDIVASALFGNTISVFLGDGVGAFRYAAFTSGLVYAIALGDFNADGNMDVASSASSQTVSLFIGAGDGTFRPGRNHSVPAITSDLTAAHLDRDSFMDLLVRSNGQTIVCHGRGDGTFTNIPGPITGPMPGTVITDLNSDGNPDAVVGNSVLFGNGDGTFREPPSFPLLPGTAAAARGDFNGDGLDDFAVANSQAGTVSVLASKRGGGLGTARLTTAPGIEALYTGDFNGDRKLDLLSFPETRHSMTILLGNGSGAFAQQPAISLPRRALLSPAIGDFNGDGKADMVVGLLPINCPCSQRDVLFFGGNGNGTFQPPKLFNVPGPVAFAGTFSAATGDFDRDGKLDLVAVYDEGLSILRGNGDGTFGSPSLIFPTRPFQPEILAIDVNTDGYTDVVISGVRIFLGNGNGTFRSPQVHSGGDGHERSFGVSDLNGDEIPDIFFVNDKFGNNAAVLLGKGNGEFLPTRFYAAGSSPLVAVPIYFNTDRKLDLAVVNKDSGSVTLLINTTDANSLE